LTAMTSISRGWGGVLAAGLLMIGLLLSEAVPMLLHPPVPAGARVQRHPSDGPAPRVSLQPILDFMPFGAAAPPEAAPLPDAPQAATIAEGTLVLQGILLRDDPALSRAMLSYDGGEAEGFAVGDPLPDGAVLSRIEADRVWIDHDGQEEMLSFPAELSDEVQQDATVQDPAEPAMQDQLDIDPNSPLTAQDPSNMPQTDMMNTTAGPTVTMPAQP
jgi:Type II secretion system protein C